MAKNYKFLWIKKTITVSGGAGTVNFELYNELKHLIIEAPNSSATFKAQLLDEFNDKHTRKMIAFSSNEGLLSTQWADGLPCIGTMTINVSEASVDGDYKLTLVYPNK
jgi:hypothetical protein